MAWVFFFSPPTHLGISPQGAKDGFNRRNAVKKFRGRLNLELTVQKGSAFSLIVLNIKVWGVATHNMHGIFIFIHPGTACSVPGWP